MKKNRYLYLLTAALLVSTAAGTLTSRAAVGNSASYTAQYSSGNLTIGTDTLAGITYSTVSYYGMFNSGEPGMPSLPVDYLKFSVPYNATNFTVTVTPRVWFNQNLDHLIYPCQVPICIDSSDSLVVALPDSSAYYSESYYPSQMAWVAGEGFLAGENHIVTVAIQPFRYFHTGNSDLVRLARTCNITLRYELSDSMSIYPIVRNDSSLREEGYQLTQSMVVNPGQVKTNTPGQYFALNDSLILVQGGIGGDVLNGGGNSLPGDTIAVDTIIHNRINYPYLIVTTSELKHAVRRIAALKRQKGYNVKVVTLEDVYSSIHSGNGDVVGEGKHAHLSYTDNAGKLRQFIRNHYIYFGTQYVLLAGDIPYRYTNMKRHLTQNDSITVPSDLYYSDINGNWFHHEYDFEPEIYIGRIIAKNEQQISNYSDKLYRYQLNPSHGGDVSYLKRAIYSFGSDFHGEPLNVYRQMDSIFPNPTVLVESKNTRYPSGENIIDSINTRNYGFIGLHHHGFPAGLLTYGFRNNSVVDSCRFLWAVDSVHKFTGYPSIQEHDPSNRNGLNNLINKWHPSICYSTACTTMPFDVIPGYENIPMNFGESFTTGKDYGGPAFIGNTREGFTPNTSVLEYVFGKNLNNGYYQIGVANALVKPLCADSEDVDKYLAICQNLLGDPEFEIWTDVPQEFSNIEIERDDHSITITGIDADSCIVGYCSNSGFPEFHIVHSDSTVLNNVSPNGMIMLYTHNYIPYIAPLELQNETINSSKYVIASDVTAGNYIDSDRPNGNVILKNGSKYEIEASGTVRLEDGFIVEKGATFSVTPSCF